MTHTVEIHRIGNNLAEAVADIQSWLDGHGIPVAEVEHSLGGPGIAFRLSFAVEAHAAAFAEAYSGRLNHGDDPKGDPLSAVNVAPVGPRRGPGADFPRGASSCRKHDRQTAMIGTNKDLKTIARR